MVELCPRAVNAFHYGLWARDDEPVRAGCERVVDDDQWIAGVVLCRDRIPPDPVIVARFTERELMGLPNMGKVTMVNVREWLAYNGMWLRPEPIPERPLKKLPWIMACGG